MQVNTVIEVLNSCVLGPRIHSYAGQYLDQPAFLNVLRLLLRHFCNQLMNSV
jgi:hypothetical protein